MCSSDLVAAWSAKSELPVERLVGWLGIRRSKFYDWRKRYGKANEHNGLVPRDFWLEPWETQAILDYREQHPLEGYRRLAFMMLDEGIVAVSPASVYRVLSNADALRRKNSGPSKKGTGFTQPLGPHMHWHIDISYLKVGGTFYYLCSVLDGYSRAILHWDIRERMTTKEVEIIVQRARERYSGTTPRIISDNGPQFIAKEFNLSCACVRCSTSAYPRDILKATARLKSGTRRSSLSVSGRKLLSLWKTLFGSSDGM